MYLLCLLYQMLKNIILVIKRETLAVSESYIFLGLTIDSKLQWNTHLEALVDKLSSAALAIKKVRQMTDVVTARLVYYNAAMRHCCRYSFSKKVPERGQSWRRGTTCGCKRYWLWVRSPLEEMKYFFKFIFPFLCSGIQAKALTTTQHAMPLKFSGKWRTS